MSWSAANQFALAVFGLAGTYLALHSRADLRRLAPIVGLAGQPFWLLSAVPSGQWGMVLLCAVYTGLYAYGIHTNWGAAA